MNFSQSAQRILDSKTKPLGSLGQLEKIAVQLACLQKTIEPCVTKKRLFVYAGSHGVTAEGVSAYPALVTGQMVRNFVGGGAAINVLARLGDIELRVIDAGVDDDLSDVRAKNFHARKIRRGTRNFCVEPAMTNAECQAAIELGREQTREADADGVQLLGIGEMGIGNTTSASALIAALGIVSPEESVGRGTGVDDEGLRRKSDAVARALALHRCDSAMDWLRCVGGFEIAAMVGTILEAEHLRLPVVVDGFIATAAAAVAFETNFAVRDVCFFAHVSHEKAHRKLLEFLRAEPILDLGLRLGEGTGSALAMHILEAAARIMTEMASFESAGVSQRIEP
jgi:nicotinate-nucleotide--dimethylbenzimidazole phosphoribosyltransferase